MSKTTEDYLKRILVLEQSSGSDMVSMGALAKVMGLTPGTITTMIKSLQDAGLVSYKPRVGVKLTPEGRKQAVEVIRRHRLIELFLVEVLGLDWMYVDEEAEVLEHALSNRVLNRIDEILGFPTEDPHGDPIPTIDGGLPELDDKSLAEMRTPAKVRISRVEHHDKDFLSFLDKSRLKPGSKITIESRNEQADTIVLQIDGEQLAISVKTAGMIFGYITQ